MVVVEQPTKALYPPNRSTSSLSVNTANPIVPQTLMIALVVEMDHIFRERAAKMGLTDRNDPV